MTAITTARVLLTGQDGSQTYIDVPCEPVNEWLCITPEFGSDKDGTVSFSGAFKVTHIPSGKGASVGGGCIECARYAALLLAKLDWPSAPASFENEDYREWFNRHPADLVAEVKLARELDWFCDAEECEPHVVSS